MKRKKAIFFLVAFLSYAPVLAQVDTAWVRRLSSGMTNALALDGAGNVYVTGSFGGVMGTGKIAPNGALLGSFPLSPPFVSEGTALALDPSGNLYMAGHAITYSYTEDYAVAKYEPNGALIWTKFYNASVNGNDYAYALAVDKNRNVYITGGSSGDYATIKYAPNGDTLWIRRYNGPVNGEDVATSSAVDESGNVYVTGYSGIYPNYDYATIKYAPNGDTLWVRFYNGPGNGEDVAKALTLDDSGYVYVTGYSIGSGTSYDYATIKYTSNGDTSWVRRFNGPVNDEDKPTALAVDTIGNVYLTGQSIGSGTSSDYLTIKYSPNGDTLWVRRYNGTGNGPDGAKALVLDDSANVYVTGFAWSTAFSWDFATIKYSSDGDIYWVTYYSGPGNVYDEPEDLAVDGKHDVYLTGVSGGGYYATIKYHENRTPILDSIGPKNVAEGSNLFFGIHASDPENKAITLSASPLLSNSVLVDSGNGRGSFSLNPDFTQQGVHYVTFKVNDGSLIDSEVVQITVTNVNQAPQIDSIGPKQVNEGSNLIFRVHATDLDVDSIILTAINLPNNSNFIDSGNGAGSFTFNPDFTQSGVNIVTFIASDSVLSDTTSVEITVQDICLAKPGDANSDDKILLSDIVTIINFLFKSHPAPNPFCRADANADGNVLLTDIVYLINFIFKSGPAPQKSRECCL